jgi:predicted dehydrogenase
MAGIDRFAVYTDYQELLARDDIDVIDVLLPPQMNLEVIRAATARGIHIICEKPIATTLEDAGAIVALAEAGFTRVLIAENFRYENAVQRARLLLDEGAISRPFMISYQWVQPVSPGDEISSRPWRQKPAHAGGIFSDHGVHMIDVLRFLMGDVQSVHVFATDRQSHTVGFDSAVYQFTFRSGAIGSIQWSFCVSSELSWSAQLWAEDGTLDIYQDRVVLKRLGVADCVYQVDGPFSFVNEFVDFYDVLTDAGAPMMTAADALSDLKTILAAHESAATGMPIEI